MIGIAGQLRDAGRRLEKAGSTFTRKDLGHEMGVKTRAEQAAVDCALKDFIRRGEVVRVSLGVFRYQGRPSGPPQIRERMWRILRARRKVTVEDLQELAGSSKLYAEEWLRMLVRRSVVRKCGKGIFRMVEDPVEMPSNEEKADKLREIRARQKLALEALERAETAVSVAKRYVSGVLGGCDERDHEQAKGRVARGSGQAGAE